ncbi:uncharacterized protein LOC117793563 [Drosophila innubila]|uniref:uncharacterized protein LOC117793563 n=1 Tax=Drosophila innubila TaxID=198719 RepID=UPI00148C02CE|nr:uncharacterized protein LOC117793563 [Drosophila innubila]
MEGGENNQLVSLLMDMMSSHPETVGKATEELSNGFMDSASIVQLCTVLSNPKKSTELRKCAGENLKKRLTKRVTWEQLSAENRLKIQSELFAAVNLMNPDDDEELPSIVLQNLGYVMNYVREEDVEPNEWNESIFNHIESLCLAQDKLSQALGSIIFKLLVKTSPKMFQNYLERAHRIFMQTAQMAEAQESLSTMATEQLLAGWAMIIPLFSKLPNQQANLESTLPHIMKMTRASAYRQDSPCDCRGFNVLLKLNKHMPELVSPHLPLVMDELYVLANDTSLNNKIRVQAIVAIRSCVRSMRRHIIRLKMMDKLLMTLHGLLSVLPALDESGEELYLGNTLAPFSPLAEAAQTILYVAGNSDTNRVAERSLRLMQPQLEQQDSPLRRLGALLFLALLAKGFMDLLSDGPLERFLSAVDKGIHDTELVVRRGAFFTLAMMAENLQPEITRLAPRVLPLFHCFFDMLSDEQRRTATDTDFYTRMFCTLEIYCESLRPEILKPHLGEVMKRLMRLSEPDNNSPALRQMSLSSIACLAKSTKELFNPHFDEVMSVSLPLVKHTPDEDQLLLRTHAIQVINSLSSVNADKFAKEAPKLLDSCMDMINHMAGAEVFTYELFGVLSGCIPKQVTPHFSLIMNGLLSCIKEAASINKASEGSTDRDDESDEDEEGEGDNENDDDESGDDDTDEESSVRGGHGDQTDVEASTMSASNTESASSTNYLNGNDEAIMCLKAFAVNMPDALLPYLSESMQRVMASANNMQECDKWLAYEALTQFILLYVRQGHTQEAKRHCLQILPAMVYFIQTAKETVNVVNVMKCIHQLLEALKTEALGTEGYADMVFVMLRRTLRRKLNCQFNIGVDMEMETLEEWSQAMHAEHQVMEAASNLIPIFGYTMRKRQFAGYFHTISKSFVKHLRACQPTGQVSRSQFLIYTMIARSMEPLGVIAEQYYDVLCYIICDCMMDKRKHIRKLAIELMDWVLTHSNEYNNAETIIQATIAIFQEALHPESPLEKDERDLLCGILARMIRIDSKSIVMEMLMPIFFLGLPLHEKFESYTEVVPALHTLYKTRMDLLKPHLTTALEVLLGSLHSKQLPNEDIRQLAIELVKSIKVDHESIYENVDNKLDEAKVLIV